MLPPPETEAASGDANPPTLAPGELEKGFTTGGEAPLDPDPSPAQPGLEFRRVHIEFPSWVIYRLDKEAGRIGVTREALLKVWVAEWLDDRRSSELPRS